MEINVNFSKSILGKIYFHNKNIETFSNSLKNIAMHTLLQRFQKVLH